MQHGFIPQSLLKKVSFLMLLIMVTELIYPIRSLALSSGPVQPEVQGFEPVGTTDMVDPFTGDFVYNIPLMDVEGYPINISYHGGVTMEQEASWVGLGWSLTPGAVNRGIRGLPDDFMGDTIEKDIHIKPEVNTKLGISVGAELFGVGQPYLSIGGDLGGYLNLSNYRGASVDFTASAGVNTTLQIVSAGMNVGASIGSQTGASINYGATAGLGASQSLNDNMSALGSVSANIGGVYSPRSGLRSSWGIGMSAGVGANTSSFSGSASTSTGTSVPIGGFQNYTAVVSNASYLNSYSGELKAGGEVFGVYAHARINGTYSVLNYDVNGSRRGFGYFHLDSSGKNDLLDFNREKDCVFNPTMNFLPQATLTYDVYSISGQGTGGSFRPFRNDIGSVFDPVTSSNQDMQSLDLEFGLGDLFEAGGEYNKTTTTITSGPWMDFKRPFTGKTTGTYEDVYFKEAGELTQNNETYLNSYSPTAVTIPYDLNNATLTKPGAGDRVIRANHIYTLKGTNDDTAALLDGRQLTSYDTAGFRAYPTVYKSSIPRVEPDTTIQLSRKSHHVTEIVQTQKDGRRYIYGLPVVNNVQREVSFAVDHYNPTIDFTRYLVGYTPGVEDSWNNANGMDNLYSSTVTPTYTAAYLLTSVLSKDYVDVTGNGISDDDLGTYTKFNYTRKSKDYRWRSPIQSGKALYNPGYVSETRDDKGFYTVGSREEWMMHSIETKNYVAEFYVSKRKDARGVLDKVLADSAQVYKHTLYNVAGDSAASWSYKLDSIVLYNKHDRFMNQGAAQPIKTVLFSYDYSLCPGVPNSTGGGKLTLKKIQIKYGTSNLNLSAAYGFKYPTDSIGNAAYNYGAKDRWGYYKPNNNPNVSNFEFPFTEQNTNTNNYAKAWSLSEIDLPSGGIIKANYESDDYGYVQDKKAMQMFMVTGMGNSPQYDAGANQLYHSVSQPDLYFYFKRSATENSQLSFRQNYLADTSIMYYNIPVSLKPGVYEPIKGYAQVVDMGVCTGDATEGYIKLADKSLDLVPGSHANPVTYTALNVGRYNLQQILYPGSDPAQSGMANILAGLQNAIQELFTFAANPLGVMMSEGRAKNVDLNKAFIRLNSPGLAKKGGGQRVKSIYFYDNWSATATGQPTYGKQYDYTIDREDGLGRISSGVASWEPTIGGDEIPQRLPVTYDAQNGNLFPPNDPVELYQEYPIGESFFPPPVVGYRKVTVTSINVDKGRSSQSQDISTFYTAKDFPTKAIASGIHSSGNQESLKGLSINLDQTFTQGFAIILNDMHGKPLSTQHWVLKPGAAPGDPSRVLVNSQEYQYLTQSGQLSNAVPSFNYNAGQGQLQVVNKTLGLESDMTMDSRERFEETTNEEMSGNLNGFVVFTFPIVIPLPLKFGFKTDVSFKSASVTKITQQYGILSKVISNNQGAITQVQNDVYDAQTGNPVVTSVNNQYNDREYTANFPAYWAYKEMGPAYQNFDVRDVFTNPLVIDNFGYYANKFVNYNPGFSSHYDLPANMPIGRMIVDENMPKYKIGDELLLQTSTTAAPVKTWVMGYASDTAHCHLILATREPYKQDAFWHVGNSYSNVSYRVVRSGNRNELGESIQSFTTTDSTNIFPYVKNNLSNLISLNAQQYDHKLDQVFAANMTSDSLNPFVTGKVGIYRPELQVINLKNRNYTGGTTRNAGTFSSTSYWQTEKDNIPGYCLDSFIRESSAPAHDTIIYIPPTTFPHADAIVNSLGFVYLGGDSIQVNYSKLPGFTGGAQTVNFYGWIVSNEIFNNTTSIWYSSIFPTLTGFLGYNGFSTASPDGGFVIHDWFLVHDAYWPFPEIFVFNDGAGHSSRFTVLYNSSTGQFTITRPDYIVSGTSGPATFTNQYYYSSAVQYNGPTGSPGGYDTIHANIVPEQPYRIRKKIMLGEVGHYDGTDNENWVNTQQVTKYNWYGEELENYDEGVGYNSAVYGYNQQLPVCVAKNARHGEVLFDGFEDYNLLTPIPNKDASYMPLYYSPFLPFFQVFTNGPTYAFRNLLGPPGTQLGITSDDAHTGNYCLKASYGTSVVPLTPTGPGMAAGYTFKMTEDQRYVASIWLKPTTTSGVSYNYGSNIVSVAMDTTAAMNSTVLQHATLTPKSNIIEGWQQYEVVFTAPPAFKHFTLSLSAGYYYDDIRISPFDANSKGFVYNPINRKLMATLDENNFATFYEYDQEGNLIRTKKETEMGVQTITESRSTHHKSY